MELLKDESCSNEYTEHIFMKNLQKNRKKIWMVRKMIVILHSKLMKQ